MSKILGISCGDHDCAACIVIDGRILAAAEEERFIRQKHAEGHFPIHAARFCLEQAQIEADELDTVACAFSPELFRQLDVANHRFIGRYARPPDRHAQRHAPGVIRQPLLPQPLRSGRLFLRVFQQKHGQ